MRHRRPAVAAALAAAALALAGCGGGDDGPKSALDDALRYLPDDAPMVAVIDTDAESEQWRQANDLIERFAVAGQLKDEAKERVQGRRDFDEDLKPLLGNPVVIAIVEPFIATTRPAPTVLAFKTKDEGKARELLKGDRRLGEAHGAEIYQQPGPRFAAIEGTTVVASPDRDALESALDRHDSGNHLTEDEFEDGLGRLDRDALIRASGDLRSALGDVPIAQAAWLTTVRRFAAVGYAKKDGLAVDFELRTEGATAAQLPLAPGRASPPVPRRKGEVAIAMREPARLFVFLDAIRRSLPKGADYGRFQDALRRIGIDLRRDILDHLGATAAVSFPLDGTFAARADLKDAAGVEEALATIAERLPRGGDTGLRIEPGGGAGFYRLTGRDGRQLFAGVVDDRLALGSDAARARDFADDPARPVPGARGSVAIHANAEDVADAIIAERAGGLGAFFGQALTAPLGDLTGWVETTPAGLTGHLDLAIE